MKFALDEQSQENYLELLLNKKISSSFEINALVDGSIDFSFQVFGNTYYLTKYTHRIANKGINYEKFISDVYNLSANIFFDLEEINENFIEYMLSTPIPIYSNLSEQIFKIHEAYINYEF